MYNPLPLFTTRILQAELGKGKRWFIRQTYDRGMETGLKAALLIRAYPAEEKETAEAHQAAIQTDRTAFLYDAGLPEHLQRLKKAAESLRDYKVFYVGREKVDWEPPELYKQKIRHYIRSQHPGWLPQQKGEKIHVGLHEKFGELFLKFSYKKQHDTIPFDGIENY